MRLRNFGCGPLAATGLFRIRDLGAAVQLCVCGLAVARRGMRHIRHRLLRMLRRVVPVEMHADHGWYTTRCIVKTRSRRKRSDISAGRAREVHTSRVIVNYSDRFDYLGLLSTSHARILIASGAFAVFQPGDTHVPRRVHAGHLGVCVQGTPRAKSEGGAAVRHREALQPHQGAGNTARCVGPYTYGGSHRPRFSNKQNIANGRIGDSFVWNIMANLQPLVSSLNTSFADRAC